MNLTTTNGKMTIARSIPNKIRRKMGTCSLTRTKVRARLKMRQRVALSFSRVRGTHALLVWEAWVHYDSEFSLEQRKHCCDFQLSRFLAPTGSFASKSHQLSSHYYDVSMVALKNALMRRWSSQCKQRGVVYKFLEQVRSDNDFSFRWIMGTWKPMCDLQWTFVILPLEGHCRVRVILNSWNFSFCLLQHWFEVK